MKKIRLSSIIVLGLLFWNYCYSQDSIRKTERLFPKNHIKFNYLSLIAHTVCFSYEREIAKRFSIELEGGYIFPINKEEYVYDFLTISNPKPFWPSQGYLGRGSVRYFLRINQEKKSVFFIGASLVYKYRYYSNKLFYDEVKSDRWFDPHILQSETNKAYAGEIQIGIRSYFLQSNLHSFIEGSISIGGGMEYRVTDVINYYWGSPSVMNEVPIGDWPSNIMLHSEITQPYFSINPCLKVGFAF